MGFAEQRLIFSGVKKSNNLMPSSSGQRRSRCELTGRSFSCFNTPKTTSIPNSEAYTETVLVCLSWPDIAMFPSTTSPAARTTKTLYTVADHLDVLEAYETGIRPRAKVETDRVTDTEPCCG